MSGPPEKWHIKEDMTIDEAEKAIENIIVSAINQLKSVKGLFRKEKDKLERTVELLKIIGAYVYAVHEARRKLNGETKGGLPEGSGSNQEGGDRPISEVVGGN